MALFPTHSLEVEHDGQTYGIFAMIMDESAFVWVGDKRTSFDDLTVSIATEFSDGLQAASSSLIGSTDSRSEEIGEKLALRFKKQIMLSMNIEKAPDMLYMIIQKKIHELLVSIGF